MKDFSYRKVAFALLISAFTMVGVASAGTQPAAAQGLDKDARQKMAVMHEGMAACLRSEKSISDCHEEMRQKCMDAFGAKGCPGVMDPGAMRMPRHGVTQPHSRS